MEQSHSVAHSAFDARTFLHHVTHKPGVYRMLNAAGEVLYVGKARNLRKRLASYFRPRIDNARIRSMVSQIAAIDISVTPTEVEALLLESNLIKQHRPRYNVLLRDDKTYPFIHLSAHAFPRLGFYRGVRKRSDQYFGPYPSTHAVRESIKLLQRLFLLRSCEDTVFTHRSRPCLEYQIKRCSAPCVGYISATDYAGDVRRAAKFLKGHSQEIMDELAKQMEQAADCLEFERAAKYRDQIAQLRQISQRQYINTTPQDVDVIAICLEGGYACVQVFSIRAGYNLGNRSFFPEIQEDTNHAALMAAFIAQYYLVYEVPATIITDIAPEDAELLCEMLSLQRDAKVTITWSVRAQRMRWVEMATENARVSLHTRMQGDARIHERLQALQKMLGLHKPIVRLECFDISHTQGEHTVAACVVFDREGPVKSDYRRFNIEGITPGDDYAAIHQAVLRRYKRLVTNTEGLPDILLIDGGHGQVQKACVALESLQIKGICVVGIAKGEGRKAEHDHLVLSGDAQPFILEQDLRALHLVQQIRDEAHRFAITAHRVRRQRTHKSSLLEDIPGIGDKRRQKLLKHFGGMHGLKQASVEELSKVPGISQTLAQHIYDRFHQV